MSRLKSYKVDLPFTLLLPLAVPPKESMIADGNMKAFDQASYSSRLGMERGDNLYVHLMSKKLYLYEYILLIN